MHEISALRREAASMSPQQFRARYGPVALLQNPPEPVLMQVSMTLARSRTVHMAHRSRLVERVLVMLRGFEYLAVHFLSPSADGAALSVGRLDCQLMLSDPSVSKHHATLRWSEAEGGFSLRDEGSTNGTWVGTAELGAEERLLVDGDMVSFGDVQLVYLHTETLHAHLLAAGA